MKFFHLSDLHIGLKLINHDLAEDQRYIFGQIAEMAAKEKPDAILIAGDIYDKAVPAAEAVELFDFFLGLLTEAVPEAEIMMISGNHDSAVRLNVYRNVLKHQKIHMIGLPPRNPDEYVEKVVLEDAFGPVNVYLLPFVKPSMVKAIVGVDENGNNLSYNDTLHKLLERENVDRTVRNVLVSHQFYLPAGKEAQDIERMDSEMRTVGNVDEVKADVLECFDYAALGHIHKPMKVGNDLYRYCGTPIACSVSEEKQQKGIVMVEMSEKGNVKVDVLPLYPLRQVKVLKGTLEEVLEQACGDYVTVILTDEMELDSFDMQDRLRDAFPFLLEIRRENVRRINYSKEFEREAVLDPFSLCCEFMGGMTSEEMDLLSEVLRTVQEVM